MELPPRVVEFIDELPSTRWVDGGRTSFERIAALLIVAGMPHGQVCQSLQECYLAAADSESIGK